MDGRWSLRQPLSPLGSGFRCCGASECQMAPKGLGLLCALAPSRQTGTPLFQEVPIVARKKFVFWPFVWIHTCGSVSACLHASGVHVTSRAWSVLLSIGNCWASRNGERSSFLHLFEQPKPPLHVPVGCAAEFGRGPGFSPLSSHYTAILLLHLLL